MNNEPELQDDDLGERLKTTIRRAEVALLLIRYGFSNYLPTILEDLFAGVQWILDLYAIDHKEEEHGTYDYLEHNHTHSRRS